jgi:hypothetical protein
MTAQATATSNGTGTTLTPPATSREYEPSWCAKHQVTMRWHDGNSRGPGWFSHQLTDGSYCKGR